MNENQVRIQETLLKHGLTVESVFVPWSRSRNKGENRPSLNWSVTLKQNGKDILTTDYSAGMGHCPGYKDIKNPLRMSINDYKMIKDECEKGMRAGQRGAILPDSYDVIYSLLLDSEVLEHDSFESWASDFGYEKNSHDAEKTYNACLKIALKFRHIGEATISELREVYQDY